MSPQRLRAASNQKVEKANLSRSPSSFVFMRKLQTLISKLLNLETYPFFGGGGGVVKVPIKPECCIKSKSCIKQTVLTIFYRVSLF